MSIGRFTINNSGEKLNSILKEDVDGEFNVLQAEATAHIANLNNPHVVTKDQVGLSNVDNVKQAAAADLEAEEIKRKRLEYYGDSNIEPTEDVFTFELDGFAQDFAIVTGIAQGATVPVFEPLVVPYECTINGTTYPVTTIASEAFKGKTAITDIILPNTIDVIDTSAFQNCTNLGSVKQPIPFKSEYGGSLSIEGYTFAGCTSLWEFELPENVNSFGNYIAGGTFDGCTHLQTVYIPKSIETIGSNAFNGCTNLATVYYGGSKEQWEDINIHTTGNDALTNATIYYNYTTVGASDISSAISAHNNNDMAHYETITLPLETLIYERMIDKGYFKPEDAGDHYPFSVGDICHIEETQDSTTAIEITHNYSVGELNISTTDIDDGKYSFSGSGARRIFQRQDIIVGSIIKVGAQEIRVIEIDYDNETVWGDVKLSYTDEPVSTIYAVPAIAVQAGDVIEWTAKGFYKFVNPDDTITTSYIDSLFS